jgi:hypothetical protein
MPSGDHVGPFESRVIGVGPQIGYIFPLGSYQGYLNLKGYGEFDAHDRPSGYNPDLWRATVGGSRSDHS